MTNIDLGNVYASLLSQSNVAPTPAAAPAAECDMDTEGQLEIDSSETLCLNDVETDPSLFEYDDEPKTPVKTVRASSFAKIDLVDMIERLAKIVPATQITAAALFYALWNWYRGELVVLEDEIVPLRRQLKCLYKELKGLETAKERDEEQIENVKERISAINSEMKDLIGSVTEYKSMVISKALLRRDIRVPADQITEFRKELMRQIRQHCTYMALDDRNNFLHPAVIEGLVDSNDSLGIESTQDKLTDTPSGYMEMLRKGLSTANTISGKSRMERSQESVYENEPEIMSDTTAYLTRTWLQENGIVVSCNVSDDKSSDLSANYVGTLEQRAVVEIERTIEELLDFYRNPAKSEIDQEDRRSLADTLRAELAAYTEPVSYNRSYRFGMTRNTARHTVAII